MKDPAFLFYTKDFQSGTQDMSCEEVGAYLRLLMYQHQNGKIPNDKERLMRICGVFSVDKFDQIWGFVNQKFKVMDNHLVNQRMNQETNERSSSKPKKTASATLAGLISSSKITKYQSFEIKKQFKIEDFIFNENQELIIDQEIIKSKVREWFKNLVNQMVNNLAIANAIANEDVNVNKDIEKGGMGEKTKTTLKPKKTKEEPKGIVLPFPTEAFKSQWGLWKIYKSKEFKFNYKTTQSEQASLNELLELSKDEKTAILIINQSMANGWKGFFKLKNTDHGKPNNSTNSGFKTVSSDYARKIAQGLQS